MPVYSVMVSSRALFPVLLLILLLGGCAVPQGMAGGAGTFVTPLDMRGLPRVSAFMSLREENSPMVQMEVAELEILAGDVWYPLTSGPLTFDSSRIAGGQIVLGGTPLPAGPLSRLRLTVTAAHSAGIGTGWTPLLTEPLVLEVPLNAIINLDAGDSRSVFLTWDVEASLGQGGNFRPVFSAAPALSELQRDLIYVTCPDIDTIFVIRADRHRVVDSFGVSGGITWPVLSPAVRDRLYLVAPLERQIKVIDLETYRTINFFPTPLNDVPTFMMLNRGGTSAYLLDERSGYLSRMDLSSGRVVARVSLGFRPVYALELPQQNLLAVTLEMSQTVVLLDPATLQLRGSLPSGSRPGGLAVVDNFLYVAERGDNSVAVFDLGNRSRHQRISVGDGPQRILATANQIYVAQALDGSLAVLTPGQLGVVHEIRNLGLPGEMVFRPLLRKLYIADRRGGGIVVVDVNTNRQVDYIELGAGPHGLVTGP